MKKPKDHSLMVKFRYEKHPMRLSGNNFNLSVTIDIKY